MRKNIKQACLFLSIMSFVIFIGVWIIAIWYDIDNMDVTLKLSATSVVLFIASVCGYIFIHEQSSEDEIREKHLSN